MLIDQYLVLTSITAGPSRLVYISMVEYIWYFTYASFVSGDQRTPLHHASVNLVYDSKPRRYAEENRTEFNCTHW